MTDLDPTDKKILQVLARDSRLSAERVADAVNLSTTPVRRRIKRLEERGLIRRYTLDVDMEQAGYGLTLHVFIKLHRRDRETVSRFEEKIRALPEISSCDLVSGPHDYILTVRATDMQAYNEFLRSVLAELPGMFGIETSIVIGRVKAEPPLPV